VSSNPYGQGPQQPGNHEDYSQGYSGTPQPAPQVPYGQQPPAPTSQPSAPTYGQTNYEQPTYAQTPGYGQAPSYGQQYAQGLAPYTAAYDSNPRPSVTMIPAVKLWLKNWKNFTGRASRSEYWWVVLASAIVMTVLSMVLVVVMIALIAADNGSGALAGLGIALMYGVLGLVGLAAFVPSLSLGIRRLHDTNQTGWLYLLTFIPSVGGIILLVLMAQASNPAGARFDDAAQPLYGPESH
jgi:uncharacterized membrane protein YhaH (DUF805 family)